MDHELLMRNTRKITELENRQRVNISNVSNEAKQLKNEGTTVKAVRGAVVCNAAVKAPNIPEDLGAQLDSKANKNHSHSFFGDITIKDTGKTPCITEDADNSFSRIRTTKVNGTSQLDLSTDTTKEKNGTIIATQYTAYFKSLIRQANILDGDGNTSFPGTLTAANVDANNETRLKAVEEAIVSFQGETQTHYAIKTYELNFTGILYFGDNDQHLMQMSDNEKLFVLFDESVQGVEVMLGQNIIDYERPNDAPIPGLPIKIDLKALLNISNLANGTEKLELRYLTGIYLDGQLKYETMTVPISFETCPYTHIKEGCEDCVYTARALFDLLYPIGSIYTSMNHVNPTFIFGGTWEQITDRFLYCADSSKETGGSKKITVAQLPSHAHSYAVASSRDGDPDGAADTAASRYNYWRGNQGLNFNTVTSYSGSGEDYMPPYMTVYAWYRKA